MNNVIRGFIELPTGIIKALWNDVFHGSRISIISAISPMAEITINRGSRVEIGSYFRARSGSRIRVRKGGRLKVGKNVSVNHGCMIVCRESISIGDDVQFSPNVLMFDHDHDYSAEDGVKSMHYKTAPIVIGNNIWIGANTVILRGTQIGNNSVIGAGSVVKGVVPSDSIYINKRKTEIREIHKM